MNSYFRSLQYETLNVGPFRYTLKKARNSLTVVGTQGRALIDFGLEYKKAYSFVC